MKSKKKYWGSIRQFYLHTGAVSEETVRAMVRGAIKMMDTDFAIATSGIMGPGGGSEKKPVGTVWIAAGNAKKSSPRNSGFDLTGKEI